MKNHDQFSREALNETLVRLGLAPLSNPFDELFRHYNEPSRFYHNSKHIVACLSQLDLFESLCERKDEVAAALWFHDAIYDTHRDDNEMQSAELAGGYLKSEDLAEEVIERIKAMILATKTHTGQSVDERLMCDIDLAILGADSAAFSHYDANIRKEYSWVPDETYRSARRQIFKGFLQRDCIYFMDAVRQRYELQARNNLRLWVEANRE
jgi:predicted metal-dependent HD superfamily phosphohydrolase